MQCMHVIKLYADRMHNITLREAPRVPLSNIIYMPKYDRLKSVGDVLNLFTHNKHFVQVVMRIDIDLNTMCMIQTDF